MEIVEQFMTQLSCRAKHHGNRHSQLAGPIKDPTTATGKHAVKILITGVARHLRMVPLIAMDGASNGIRNRRIGSVCMRVGIESVWLTGKLARRLKERNVI